MSSRLFWLLVLSHCAAPITPVLGADSHCVLTPDVSVLQNDVQLTVAYLESITEKNFDEAKKNFDYGISTVVEFVPLDGKMSYNDFKKSRSEYFKRIKYSSSSTDKSSYVLSKVNANNLEAYQSCLMAEIAGLRGSVTIIPLRIDANMIDARIVWYSPSKTSKAGTIKWTVSGISNKADLPTSIDVNGEVLIFAKRKPSGGPVSLHAEIGSQGGSLLLNEIPPADVLADDVYFRRYVVGEENNALMKTLNLECPAGYRVVTAKCDSTHPAKFPPPDSYTKITDGATTIDSMARCDFAAVPDHGVGYSLDLYCTKKIPSIVAP